MADSEELRSDAGGRQQKKVESRRRILDSARDIFFRDGFMAANLDEVAEKAGVAKGTLYRYFESKADLYVAVLAENGKVFTDKIVQASTAEPSSAVEQVRSISKFYFAHWTEHPEYFQIFWALDNQPVIGDLPGAVVDEVTRLWEQSLEILDATLQRAVKNGEIADCDTWQAANILWTLANAIIQSESTMARRGLRRRPLEEVYAEAIDLALRGLRAGGEST